MEVKQRIKIMLSFLCGGIMGVIIALGFTKEENDYTFGELHDDVYANKGDSLKLCVLSGDKDAMWILKSSVVDDTSITRPKDLLYYHMVMVEKYKLKSSCYEIYTILLGDIYKDDKVYHNENWNIPEIRLIALHYLKVGEEMGDYNCANTISILLRKKKINPAEWKSLQYYQKRTNEILRKNLLVR